MTNEELGELNALRLNVQRLIVLVGQQRTAIEELRSELRTSQELAQTLRKERDEAEQGAQMMRVAGSLIEGSSDSHEATAFVAEIIQEIEYCLRQLRAE